MSILSRLTSAATWFEKSLRVHDVRLAARRALRLLAARWLQRNRRGADVAARVDRPARVDPSFNNPMRACHVIPSLINLVLRRLLRSR